MERFVTLYNNLIWDYQQAVGMGWYVILWVLCLLYCMLGRMKKIDRVRFVVPVMFVFLVVSCPITAIILMKILDVSTYSRFAWCLLVLPVIAYVMTNIIEHAKERRRVWYFVLAVVVIVCCGSWIYTPENFVKADNAYKLSEHTIEVSDYLVDNCQGEIVYVDESLICEVRQYTASVKMLYGRYGGGPGEGINSRYANSSEAQFGSYLDEIVSQGCTVIVLSVSVPNAQEVFEKNNWMLTWTNGTYNIFQYTYK